MAPAVIARNERGVTVRATRITTPMIIDGRLDEAVYAQVPAITEFVQQEPQRWRAGLRIHRGLGVLRRRQLLRRVPLPDADPVRIVANDMRRDSTNLRQNDNFGVFLDTFHDRRNGYLFYVSPVGGMFDGATANERTNNADWNTVWNAKVTRSPDGWIAEIAIPFKSLRYRAGREQTWGINLRRTIRGKNEYAYIAPIRPEWGVGGFFRASAAATLVGLEVPPAGKNLEIKPYAISRLTTDLMVTPAGAQRRRARRRPRRQVRRHQEPDRRLHLQHRLRAGRGRRSAGEPHALQPAVSREARVLPGRAGHLHLRHVRRRATGCRGSGASDAPTIFYSRRIGLEGASGRADRRRRPRLAGRVGRYSIGALNIATDGDASPAVADTNFTVLRRAARRAAAQLDRRRCSRTAPSRVAAPAATRCSALDGTFVLVAERLRWAATWRTRAPPAATRDAVSYRANFNYARRPLRRRRSTAPWSATTSIPKSGSCAAAQFRRNFAVAALQSAPAAQRARFASTSTRPALDYTTNNQNRLESRTR